jgi:type IV fimbrial biogenesis protein FimT
MSSPALHRRLHATVVSRPPRRVAGLTLIELMVALAVLAVLVSIALPSLAAQLERRRLVAASAEVAASLQLARSQALVSGLVLRTSVLQGDNRSCLIVHTGSVADCRCGAEPTCLAGAVIERALVLDAAQGFSVQANVASLRHDPRSGTTTPTGTVQVRLRGAAIHHVVNLGGRVRTCAPAPGLPGFAPC